MYKISFVVFLNINLKRYYFYKLIYDFWKNKQNNVIHKNDLIQLGQRAQLTYPQTLDEIIGLLYAPYIIDKTGEGLNFHLTDNAYLKFSDLLTEGSHQENDLGIMLHIEGRINRLTMHLTDCLSDKFIQKLTAREWSRNKSKYRLMKKHKNFEVILSEIENLLSDLDVSEPNDNTFVTLLKNYGRPWKTMIYTGNFMFKGNYSSSVIPQYKDIFSAVLDECKQPIDWQGKPINDDSLKYILSELQEEMDLDSFVSNSIEDGILRHIEPKQYSLTSSGYILIRSYLKNLQGANVFHMFFRRVEDDLFLLKLGINTLFNKELEKYILEKFKYDNRGWYSLYGSKAELLSCIGNLYKYAKGIEEGWRPIKLI